MVEYKFQYEIFYDDLHCGEAQVKVSGRLSRGQDTAAKSWGFSSLSQSAYILRFLLIYYQLKRCIKHQRLCLITPQSSSIIHPLTLLFNWSLLAIVDVYMNQGNEEYSKDDFRNATHFYTEGINVNCKDEELNAKLYSNRGTVQFLRGEYFFIRLGSDVHVKEEVPLLHVATCTSLPLQWQRHCFFRWSVTFVYLVKPLYARKLWILVLVF